MKSHVLLVVLLCCTIDAFLITIGVRVGQLIITIPHLLHITKYGGAIFFVMALKLSWMPTKQRGDGYGIKMIQIISSS